MTHPAGRRSRAIRDTRASRTSRREALLDAAVAAIRREGPGASMRQMAAEAGITKPILYRYFGDRDGLLTAMATRFADQVTARLQEATEAAGPHPRAALAAGIEAWLEVMEEDIALYRFLAQRSSIAGPAVATVVDRVAQPLTQQIGATLRDAGADSGAAEAWAYGIVGMAHMAGLRWLSHPTVPRAQLVEYLVALVWNGMPGFTRRHQ
ncbi:MAG: TetR/AcrR family transcriptional regulator [Acidimicrobiales bacterium]